MAKHCTRKFQGCEGSPHDFLEFIGALFPQLGFAELVVTGGRRTIAGSLGALRGKAAKAKMVNVTITIGQLANRKIPTDVGGGEWTLVAFFWGTEERRRKRGVANHFVARVRVLPGDRWVLDDSLSRGKPAGQRYPSALPQVSHQTMQSKLAQGQLQDLKDAPDYDGNAPVNFLYVRRAR